MIVVQESSVPRFSSQSFQITQHNKVEITEDLKNQYHRSFTRNSLTYQGLYQIIVLLVEGLYNQNLVSQIFQNIKKDLLCINSLRKYINSIEQVLSNDDSDTEEDIADICFPETDPNQEQWLQKAEQVVSDDHKPIKYLIQDISICSGQIFSVQQQTPKSEYFPFPLKSLEVVRLLQLTILPSVSCCLSSSAAKTLNVSQISTNSSQSKTKSHLLSQKTKQFLIRVQQPEQQNIDYKKEYQKKLHNTILKSTFMGYKSGNKCKR